MIESAFVAAIAGLAAVALVRPWIGLLAYTWVSLMVPHRMLAASLHDFPAAWGLAAATLLGMLWTRERAPLPRAREVVLLGAFWAVCAASTLFTAFEPERAWPFFERFSKILLMLLPALLLLQGARRLRLWVATIALTLGGLGVITGVRGVATGLNERIFGPAGSIVGDNNALGFALVLAVPLLLFLGKGARSRWAQGFCFGVVVLTVIGIVATYSRGSLVLLAVALAATLLLAREARRGAALLVAFLAGLVLLAPAQWRERMDTIRPDAYRVDSSGSERMKSWYVAWRIGLDHPLLGAGFQPFSEDVYERYIPGYRDFHNAHNHFLQAFAEHGFTGLALFVALFVSAFTRLLATVRRARGDPALAWADDCARMFAVFLVTYIAGGVFLSLGYFELLYQVLVACLLLDRVTARPSPEEPPADADPLVVVFWRRLRGTA